MSAVLAARRSAASAGSPARRKCQPGLERVVQHSLAVRGGQPVQLPAPRGRAEQAGVAVVADQGVQVGPGRVVDQLPAAQFVQSGQHVIAAPGRLTGIDQPLVEQIHRVTEHRDERDQPAARLTEIAQRGLQQIADDAGLRLQAADDRGGSGPARAELAERQTDQHRAAAGPVDEGIGE